MEMLSYFFISLKHVNLEDMARLLRLVEERAHIRTQVLNTEVLCIEETL